MLTQLTDTLKAPTTWSHVEVCVALISACLPTLRPLVTMFLNAVGFERSQSSEKPTQNQQYVHMENGKHSTQITTTSENGTTSKSARDTWSSSTKHDQYDEVPLNTIHIQTDYEQHVEADSLESDEWAKSRRKNYYLSS